MAKGWNSLLLPLNYTHLETIYNSQQYVTARIQAPIILLGYACQGETVIKYANQTTYPAFTAYITLGLATNTIAALDSLHLNAPLLDIQSAAYANRPRLSKGKRIVLPTADKYFSNKEDKLLFLMTNWLRTF